MSTSSTEVDSMMVARCIATVEFVKKKQCAISDTFHITGISNKVVTLHHFKLVMGQLITIITQIIWIRLSHCIRLSHAMKINWSLLHGQCNLLQCSTPYHNNVAQNRFYRSDCDR